MPPSPLVKAKSRPNHYPGPARVGAVGCVQSGEGTGEAQMECARMFQFKAGLIPLRMWKVCMGLVTRWGTQGSSRSGWVSGEKKNTGVPQSRPRGPSTDSQSRVTLWPLAPRGYFWTSSSSALELLNRVSDSQGKRGWVEKSRRGHSQASVCLSCGWHAARGGGRLPGSEEQPRAPAPGVRAAPSAGPDSGPSPRL